MFSKLAAGEIYAAIDSRYGGAVASAVIGGTASVVAGGKFANGATTGAFSYLFVSADQCQAQSPRQLALSDLQVGDVLLTGEGGLAEYLKGIGEYGHASLVLGVNGDTLTVLSADERGIYVSTNIDPFVGGRTWDVFRVSGIDTIRIGAFASQSQLGGGISQYFGNGGGNVCSSVCARAIEFAGGSAAPRLFNNLLTPNSLAREYGPPIGQINVPLLVNSQ